MKRQHKNWIFFVYVIRRRRGHKKKYIRNHLSAVQQITVAHHGIVWCVFTLNKIKRKLKYWNTHARIHEQSSEANINFPLCWSRDFGLCFSYTRLLIAYTHTHQRDNERHCPSTVSYVREVYVLLAPVCISSNELIN